jgi:anti-sigma regulatory factor (Ser/Thr protein kinase)
VTAPMPRDPRSRQHARAAFPSNVEAVTAARKYTQDNLVAWGATRESLAASLIVSELAANAVRHAGSGFEVALACEADAIRIVVSDQSDVLPTPRPTESGSTSGYGLNIVRILATDWGCTVGDGGKEIWVELAHGPGTRRETPDGSALPR